MVGLATSTRQLALQGGEVGVRGVVLQLPGHLRLLGLSTAAPHGSTPSHRMRGSPKAGPDDVRHLSWLLRYMGMPPFGTSGYRQPALRVAVNRPSQSVPGKERMAGPAVTVVKSPRSTPTSSLTPVPAAPRPGAEPAGPPPGDVQRRWIVRSRPTSAIRRSA